MFVYVGTYTGSGKAEGIYIFRLDRSSGALAHAHTVAGLDNPSFLALHPRQPLLFAVSEDGSGDEPTGGGNAVVFAIFAFPDHLWLHFVTF